MRYFLFLKNGIFKISHIVCIHSKSQFRLATFHMLSNHRCLLASVLDSTALESYMSMLNYRHKIIHIKFSLIWPNPSELKMHITYTCKYNKT